MSSYGCSLASVGADFTNTATVTGTPPSGPDVNDQDTAEVDVVTPPAVPAVGSWRLLLLAVGLLWTGRKWLARRRQRAARHWSPGVSRWP
jgi:hypothetical protein